MGCRIRIQSSLIALEKRFEVKKMDFSKREYKELYGVPRKSCTNAEWGITSEFSILYLSSSLTAMKALRLYKGNQKH